MKKIEDLTKIADEFYDLLTSLTDEEFRFNVSKAAFTLFNVVSLPSAPPFPPHFVPVKRPAPNRGRSAKG